MDQKIAEVTALRRQVETLRGRVDRLETGLFRAVVAVGAAALVLGFFVPFLSATGEASGDAFDDDESVTLLTTVFGIGGAGGGPFREEAVMAAVVVGVFCLTIAVALVALLRLFRDRVGSRPIRFARACGIVLLVACAAGWLLVFALAVHFDGRTSAFSPATLCCTIGGGAMLAAAVLHPADWRD